MINETEQERLLRHLKRKDAYATIQEVWPLIHGVAGMEANIKYANAHSEWEKAGPKFEHSVRKRKRLQKIENHKAKSDPTYTPIDYQRKIQMQEDELQKWHSLEPVQPEVALFEERGWTMKEIQESGALQRFEENGFK